MTPAPTMRGHDLTQGRIGRTLALFALPILLSNVLQTVNGSVNAIWVGHFLGEEALAATSIGNTLIFLLLSLVFGIGMAVTILVGQDIGARRLEEAKRAVGTGATLFGLTALGIALFGVLFTTPLLELMETPDAVMDPATTYLRISFAGMPFMLLWVFVTMVLRGAGDSRTPLLFLILSVLLDIALNPLLIFGWGPVPRLGIAGSASATVIANLISLAAVLTYLHRKRHFLWLGPGERHYFRPRRDIAVTLVRKGIPMGLQMILMSGSAVMMLGLVNRHGAQTTAAFGAAMQLWNYIQMPAMAIGMAVSSMAAQNVGAARWDRIDRIALTGVGYGIALTGTLVLTVFVFSGHTLGLFLPDHSPAMAIGQHINAIAVWSFLFFSVAMTLMGVVRATGAVIVPLLNLFVALWVIRLPFAWLLSERWPDALWWSYPLGSLMAMLFAIAYYRWGGWRHAQMLSASSAAVRADAA